MTLCDLDHLELRRLRRHSLSRSGRAFTLIELLVAATVLAFLVLCVAQMVQSGNLIISASRKHLTADSQAREVFSRFDLDIRRMPKRADMDAIFSSSNNTIFFFSEASGFFAGNPAENNTLALVGYRVNANAELERLGKGLAWTNSLFLTYPTSKPATNSTAVPSSTLEGSWASVLGTAPAYANGSDPDYHVFADGVFRIFYCFQKKDGSYSLTVDPDAIKGKLGGVSSIVLTLAILDTDSRKIAGDVSRLAEALGPSPTSADLAAGKLAASLWEPMAKNVSAFAAAAGIPESAASRVRIYQRSFPLRAP